MYKRVPLRKLRELIKGNKLTVVRRQLLMGFPLFYTSWEPRLYLFKAICTEETKTLEDRHGVFLHNTG